MCRDTLPRISTIIFAVAQQLCIFAVSASILTCTSSVQLRQLSSHNGNLVSQAHFRAGECMPPTIPRFFVVELLPLFNVPG